MRIDHTDENDAIIPRPESPAQQKAELREDTSTWGILKSGWGLFFVVAGALSVVFDLSIPGDFPLFRGGSFTLGWIFIVGVLIVPAACARHFGAAPINRALAVIWCIAGFVAWVVIHSITAGVDPGKPVRPNLALLGGLILCWRLLTKPQQECPNSVIEEDPASDEGTQTTASAAPKTTSSPAKVSLKHERQITASQPLGVSIAHVQERMSDRRKKIVAVGWLGICAVSIVKESGRYSWGTPSLSWLVLLCATWALIVWLWPEKFNKPKLASVVKTSIKWIICCALIMWAVQFGIREAYHSKLAVDFYREKNQLETERDAAKKDIRAIVDACITLREAKAEHEIFNAAVNLREQMKSQQAK
jgi:hypothetical protein